MGGFVTWPSSCFLQSKMTNTEFIARSKSAAGNPLLKAAQRRFRLVDGMIILAFLAIFLGLVFLLSR